MKNIARTFAAAAATVFALSGCANAPKTMRALGIDTPTDKFAKAVISLGNGINGTECTDGKATISMTDPATGTPVTAQMEGKKLVLKAGNANYTITTTNQLGTGTIGSATATGFETTKEGRKEPVSFTIEAQPEVNPQAARRFNLSDALLSDAVDPSNRALSTIVDFKNTLAGACTQKVETPATTTNTQRSRRSQTTNGQRATTATNGRRATTPAPGRR